MRVSLAFVFRDKQKTVYRAVIDVGAMFGAPTYILHRMELEHGLRDMFSRDGNAFVFDASLYSRVISHMHDTLTADTCGTSIPRIETTRGVVSGTHYIRVDVDF